jgi:hypothetical protein
MGMLDTLKGPSKSFIVDSIRIKFNGLRCGHFDPSFVVPSRTTTRIIIAQSMKLAKLRNVSDVPQLEDLRLRLG